MINRTLLTAGVAAALALTATTAPAKLYRWVDENGKVHYSDKVPPEAADKQRQIKNDRGVTVEVEKSQAEKEAEAKAEAERRARQKAEQEMANQDKTLLLTFTSIEEMKRARDDRVAAVDVRMRLTQERVDKLQTQLDQARKQAAEQERAGKASPAELYKRIKTLEQQIADYQKFIDERQAEREAIISKFDVDMARFKELTEKRQGAAAGGQPAATTR